MTLGEPKTVIDGVRRRLEFAVALPMAGYLEEGMTEPLSREALLATGLAELGLYWLAIRCGCGASAFYPCRLLAQQRGGALRLKDVVPRLRC